ncbi:MAG: hypothetical protein FP831_07945 [Anaerolineae bacterium]|nr:hypothetical protein [Anaerolineae bacterium]
MLTIITTFIGIVLTIITTVVFEKLRNPKLVFLEENDSSDNLPQGAPAHHIKLLRVKLINKEMPKLFSWLRREPANHCSVDIQVLYHDDKKPLFAKPISARWSHSDPPSTIHLDPQTQGVVQLFDWSKYNEIMNRDCFTGIPEPIDIVARFDSDNDCYIYNNDSFYPNYINWRSEKKKIPQGRYYLIITARYSGLITCGFFELENNLSIDHFRLTSISPAEFKVFDKLFK